MYKMIIAYWKVVLLCTVLHLTIVKTYKHQKRIVL